MKSPIALLDNLFSDLKRLNPGVKGLDRDLNTVKRRTEHEGNSFLTITLPVLDSAILIGLSTRKFACPPGFKTIRKGAIPVLLQGMLCEVFDPITGLLKETVDYGILRDIHMFLNFFKKTSMTDKDEDSLHQKAVKEFYQCDETARSVIIADRHDRLIGLVGSCILPTLRKKDYEHEAIYRHGPGAVEESYRGNQKWSNLYRELRDFVHVPDWFGHTNFRNLCVGFDNFGSDTRAGIGESSDRFSGSPGTSEKCPSLLSGVPPQTHVFRSLRSDPSGSSHRTDGPRVSRDIPLSGPDMHQRDVSARLISVLKNSTSRRTITVEPFLRQYLQQGLNTMLRKSITECRVLSNCLALTDQSVNQKLALIGSRTDKWATIDLKSASDLLSIKLVESVFRHHPTFVECLMDSRSPYVYTDGEKSPPVPLGKFAGMGNATTFPVQSVCFAVVCIAAILDRPGFYPKRKDVERASRLVRIYGDDIIVDTNHAHQVVQWLHDVGLKVNVKKSFLSGNFKESCGVEAYNGVDITPLYIRHWPHQIDESPSVCAHLVSLSNHLWMQGLYSTSNYLKETVEGYLGNALPLVSSQSGSLGWHTRQDCVEPHKWCYKTHQFLTRTFALKPVKIRDRLDGYAALLKCLTTPLLGRDKDHLERTAKRYQIRLVRRWVPSYSYEGLNLQA